jgi:5-methylthioadenosine/S-adenosylhomocysteine deaminase
MATRQGARTLGLEDTIGSIEIGKKADIVLMDMRGMHSQPAENIYSQIVYSARSTDVQTVIIDGRVIMKDRELKTIDEERVMSDIGPNIKKILHRI